MDTPKKKVDLKIQGMTCAMCVQTIEGALNDVEGVIDANVNLGAEKAYVIYNPKMVSIQDLKKAIEETGYSYLGVEGKETEDFEQAMREKDLKAKMNRIILGFTVGPLLMLLMFVHLDLGFPMSYLMLILATPTFAYISYPIFGAAYRALKNNNLNMDVMYSMGI